MNTIHKGQERQIKHSQINNFFWIFASIALLLQVGCSNNTEPAKEPPG